MYTVDNRKEACPNDEEEKTVKINGDITITTVNLS